MTKKYTFSILIVLFFLGFYACSDDQGSSDDGEYTPISPVTVDLTQVPYEKLSDYKFFEGTLKDQNPSLDVLVITSYSIHYTKLYEF